MNFKRGTTKPKKLQNYGSPVVERKKYAPLQKGSLKKKKLCQKTKLPCNFIFLKEYPSVIKAWHLVSYKCADCGKKKMEIYDK